MTTVILQRCRIQIHQHFRIKAEHEYLLTLPLSSNQLPVKFIFKEEKMVEPKTKQKNPRLRDIRAIKHRSAAYLLGGNGLALCHWKDRGLLLP